MTKIWKCSCMRYEKEDFEIFKISSIKICLWRFFRRFQKGFLKILYEDIQKIFWPFWTFNRIFSKLKIKTKTRRSSLVIKNIFTEDLPKISKRFEPKILRRYQNDFNWRSLKDLKSILGRNFMKDLLKKINVYLVKIFRRKDFKTKSS